MEKRDVYLDNAATSHPKPECVLRAVRASVGHETTFEDVEALLRAVKKMLRET